MLEALDAFESKVLELDRLVRRDKDHRALVHILFRLAHNLKSAFSAAGLEGSVSLLHSCESCLDALRGGDGRPSERLSDLFVATIDALRLGVDGRSDDTGALRRELDAEAAELRSSKPAVRGIDFALEEEELRRLGEGTGETLYVLEKLIGGSMDEASTLGLPVFETIAGLGRTIAHRLKRPKGSSDAVLVILFATSVAPEELGVLLFDPLFPVAAASAPPAVAAKPPAPPSPASSLPRILLVDDEALSLVLLQKALVDFGRIDTASSGREALDRFAEALGAAPYSVVFLDINMADILGTAVLSGIRRMEREAGVAAGEGARVVMSSALRDFETVALSFREQCELYLIKPVDAAKIRDTMAKLGFSTVGR